MNNKENNIKNDINDNHSPNYYDAETLQIYLLFMIGGIILLYILYNILQFIFHQFLIYKEKKNVLNSIQEKINNNIDDNNNEILLNNEFKNDQKLRKRGEKINKKWKLENNNNNNEKEIEIKDDNEEKENISNDTKFTLTNKINNNKNNIIKKKKKNIENINNNNNNNNKNNNLKNKLSNEEKRRIRRQKAKEFIEKQNKLRNINNNNINNDIIINRNIRQQQEEEYKKSLENDQIKDIEKLSKKQLINDYFQTIIHKKQELLKLKETIPIEPDNNDEEDNIINVRIHINNQKILRKFFKNNKLIDIYNYINTLYLNENQYDLNNNPFNLNMENNNINNFNINDININQINFDNIDMDDLNINMDLYDYDLAITFPFKKFTEEEKELTLDELKFNKQQFLAAIPK